MYKKNTKGNFNRNQDLELIQIVSLS